MKKAIRFPFLPLSIYFTAVKITQGISLLGSTELYKAVVLLLLPMQESQSLKYDGLMLMCFCFGLQQCCQSFQSVALRFFPDIWAELILGTQVCF